MTTSKSIAGLIGPTLVVGAVAVLLNLGTWPALVEQGFRDPALIFESGFPLFVAGLAIVRAHNRWRGGWPVLVTIVGWLVLLAGFSRILFPTRLAPIAVGAVQRAGVLPAWRLCFWWSAPSSPSKVTAAHEVDAPYVRVARSDALAAEGRVRERTTKYLKSK